MLENLNKDLRKLQNTEKARVLSSFFKTGKGEYGEGDVFLGISVPDQRRVAKKYPELPLKDVRTLLQSKVHEHRLTALLVLVGKLKKADGKAKEAIAGFYLKNTKRINNWDLVDLSAPNILGEHLIDKDKSILLALAKSPNLWERRIAIVSTFAFIRRSRFGETLKISEILLDDKHDLIHKAVGWMLREVGKRNQEAEEQFLERHCKRMPRTMLRYAIERFDEEKRKPYLKR